MEDSKSFLAACLLFLHLIGSGECQQIISQHPENQFNIEAGNNVVFSVTLSETLGNEQFFWVFNRVQISAGATGYSGLGTRELVVLSANSDDVGTYSVAIVLGGGVGGFIFSDAATLTLLLVPVITAQPLDQLDIPAGTNAVFSVTATDAVNYQWQTVGVPSVDISTSDPGYTGADTASLTVLAVDLGDTAMYQCVARNGLGPTTSDPAQLTVLLPPTIGDDDQPTDANVAPGNTAIFTVATSGEGLRFQWFMVVSDAPDIALTNGGNMFGATTNSLAIIEVMEANEGDMYYVVVTNDAGFVQSNTVSISVVDPPVISVQPLSLSAQAPGASVTFTVVATGTGLTYQWLLDGIAITDADEDGSKYSGTNSATLTVNDLVHPDDEGSYIVIVENVAGSVNSDPATPEIVEPINIISDPESVTVAVGESASFTVIATGDALTYQWRRNEANLNSANTAKYTGVTEATLVVMNAVDVDDEGAYSVVISNAAGDIASDNTAILTILTLPLIITEPESQVALSGATVTFSIVAMGDGLVYQWLKDMDNIVSTDVNYSGAQSATLTIVAAREPEDEGVYDCVVVNAVGLDTSMEATLEIINCATLDPAPTNGVITYSMVPALLNGGYSSGATATYSCTMGQLFNGDTTRECMNIGAWSGTAPECLDYCEPLSVTDGDVIYDKSENLMSNYPSGTVATHSCSADFGFVGESTRTCMASAVNIGLTTWSGEPINCQLAECPELDLANGQISYASDSTPDIVVGTEATHTCDNAYALSGASVLTCTQGNPNNIIGIWDLPSPTCDLDAPVIDNEPQDQIDINQGQDATFTVVASGVMLIYQWMKDGAAIADTPNTYSGTMSDTLTVLSVDSSDEGEYSVLIANNADILSEPATLTILLIPTITTQPLDMCITQGNSFTLSVAASSRFLTYQWFAGTSLSNGMPLIDGGQVSGATSDELTIMAAAATTTYFVIVSNPAGTAMSTVATITVVNAPDISVQPSSLANQIPGEDVMFTVTASAECGGLTYQWFMGESMLTDSDKYGGVTTDTLTVMDIIHPDDEGAYTVMVSSLFSTVESSVADLDIVEPISITRHPMDTTVAIGAAATFTVMADGDSPSYQWMFNRNPITETPLKFIGVTTSTLMVLNAVDGDEGRYSVMVTNAASPAPGVVSNPATLTALAPISITTPPADEFNVAPGTDVVFTCAASGDSPSYQWRKDSDDITNSAEAFEGATTVTLTVINAQADDVGLYSCVVSNVVSTQTSTAANLQLSPEFTFSSAEYEVAEGNRMITVHMDFISGFINENVEIVLSTSDDSAVNTMDSFGCFDYTATMATLTFTVGTRPRSSGYRMAVNIPINNDNCVELEETFDVTATAMDSNVRFQIGGDSTVVSIPANDEIIISFSQDTYTVDETSPTVAIIFSLTESSGVLTFPIVLTLSDAGGSSATNGGDDADYNYINPEVTIPAASGPEDSITVNIEIVNDLRDEPTEIFNIQVARDSNRANFLNNNNLAQVQIMDDDVCLVGVEMADYAVSEDLATVEVCLVKMNNVILASAITVRVSTGDVAADSDVDSAEADVDYTQQDNVALTFGPSDTRSCISIPINNEELEEMTENFGVFFTSESPESLNFMEGQDNAEVRILNDDENCPALSSIRNGMPISYLPIVLANGQYLIDTVATYSCSDGQLFNGDITRTCMSTREWSGTAPVCLDYCPLLTLLDNGMITYDPAFGNINGNFPEETTANFECDADYTLVGSERICTASDGSGMGSWSGVDAVCQLDAPVITDQPDDQIDIIQGMNAIFSVEASGLMLTYQWQKGGVGISDTDDTYSGTTSKTLTVISVTEPDDNGDFRVVVTNPTGSVTSTPATLTVLAPPIIETDPQDMCVAMDSSITLSVTASGRDLSYQWFQGVNSLAGEATDTLTVTVTATTTYSVEVSNAAGVDTSEDAVITIVTIPQFTVQPSSVANQLTGSDVTFTAEATVNCGDLSYQWCKDGEPIPLLDEDDEQTQAQKYSGSTTNSLTVHNIMYPDDEGVFTLKITNDATAVIESMSATLDILDPPMITIQPLSLPSAPEGEDATFTVEASGLMLSYQWQKDGVPIVNTEDTYSGTQSETLRVLSVTEPDDNGMFRVVVTNPTGSVTSTPATLTVLAPPIIETDPQDMCVAMDSSITLSVTASGRDLSYQWFQGVNSLAGETTDTLTVTVTATTTYSVEVSNAAGVDTSEDAVITIVTIPQFTVQPSSVANQLTGNDVTFTAEATVNCGDLSYQWCKDGEPIPQSDKNDEGPEEKVKRVEYSVTKYSGSTTNSLTIHNIMYPDDEGVFTLKVTNDAAAVIESMSATLDILDPPMITIQPLSLPSAPEGEDATFTVEASGLMLSYQWQKDGVPIVNTENTYSGTQSETLMVLSVTEPDDNGMFRVVVTNPTGSVTSTPATLTVLAPPIIETDPQDMCVAMGSSITLSVTASGRDLSYQWFQGVNLLVGETTDTLTVTVTATTTYSVEVSNAAGVDTSEDAVITIVTIPQFTVQPSSVANQLTGNDVTFTAEATVNCGDLSYQWCKDGEPIPQSDEYDELNPLEEKVKRTREEYSGSTTNSLTIHNIMYPDDEGVFTLKVTNDAAAVIESMSATLDILDPPMITIQPLSLPSAPEGEDATFTVEASGLMLSYQWQKDGIPIENTEDTYSGTQSETLRVLSVTEPDDNGMFRVVVTNPTGSVTSTPATLTVLAPPIIETDPQDMCVAMDSSITLSVTASGRDLSYQWFQGVNSLVGETTDMLTVTVTATTTYSVEVSNAAGMDPSEDAVITIVTIPQFTVQPSSVANQLTGNDVTFTAEATVNCGDLSYQWCKDGVLIPQSDEYNELNPLEESVKRAREENSGKTQKYSGSTTNSLTIHNIMYPDDEGVFTLKVTNDATAVIESMSATLDILDPPMITIQPLSLPSAPEGEDATFTVEASGLMLSYQWQKDGVPIVDTENTYSGTQSETLMVLSVTEPDDNGMFTVVVTNPTGSVTSTPATLSVLAPPIIETDPQDMCVAMGSSITLSVTASGRDLSYQWFQGVNSLVGERTDTLTVTVTATTTYSVEVSNAAGMDPSEDAVITIVTIPQFTVQPSSVANQLTGNDVTFTAEATVNCGDLSYQWCKDGVLIPQSDEYNELNPLEESVKRAREENSGKTQKYSGSTTNSLTIHNIMYPDDEGVFTLKVTNDATAVIESMSTTLDILDPPMITIQPLSLPSAPEGEDATFTVEASGLMLSYQWQKDGVSIVDTENTYSGTQSETLRVLSVTEPDNNGMFTVVVTNPTGSVTSTPATLTVLAPPIIETDPQDMCVAMDSSITLSVTASGRDLSYQWFQGVNLLVGETTDTLTVTVTATTTYSVEVSNAAGVDTSEDAVITIVTIPQFTVQPSSVANQLTGNDVTFTAEATVNCGDLSYQWCKDGVLIPQSDEYNELNPLEESVKRAREENSGKTQKYSGSTTNSLTIHNIMYPDDEGVFTLKVTNDATAVIESMRATLDILDPPMITIQPLSLPSAPEDEDATFTVEASGLMLSYQWQKDGVPIVDTENTYSGTQSETLRVLSVTEPDDNGMFTVVVTNPTGSVTSMPATLTVLAPPIIETDPQDMCVAMGSSITLSVTASGRDLSYQWFQGVNLLVGETTDTLTVTVTATTTYSIEVSNAAGVDTSEDAVITIVTIPQFTVQPSSVANQLTGNDVTFTAEATVNCGDLSYQWCKDGVLIPQSDEYNELNPLEESVKRAREENSGKTEKYSGSTTNSLTIHNIMYPDDEGVFTLKVTNDATAVIESMSATLDILDPPMITIQPLSLPSAPEGEDATFTVEASGLMLSYQWQKDGVPIIDTENTYSGTQSETLRVLSVTEPDDNGMFRVVVTNPTGSVTSTPTTLTVLAPPIIETDPQDMCVAMGSSITLSVTASGRDLSYQWFQGVNLLVGETTDTLTVTVTATTTYSVEVSNAAGVDTSEDAVITIVTIPQFTVQPSSVANQLTGNDVTFTAEATVNCGDLSYQWCKDGVLIPQSDEYNELNPLEESVKRAREENSGKTQKYSGSTTNSLTIHNIMYPDDEGVFTLKVTNDATAVIESMSATLDILDPPMITIQPLSLPSAPEGEDATFTVEASGLMLSYQWQKNGVPIVDTENTYSGTQSETLRVLSVTEPDDNGMFTVVVTNPTGSVTSTPATLTVLAPPIIETDPQDMCVAMDSSITLSVTASGRDLSYQWFQGVNLLVGETTDTLTVTVTATTTYSVEVSNAAGVDTSEDAVITIVTIPQFTVQPSSMANQLTGNDVTFTAEATVNCGDISYQWCKDGVLIPQSDEYNELNPLEESVKRAREENSGKTQKYSGSTTNSLTIHNIMYPDDEGVFTLKVTNDAAAVIESMSATLDILDPPMITIQPLSLPSAPEGEDATFTVEASGLMLSYQWQKDGVPIVDTENTYSGTQSETLRVLSVTEPDDNGMFRVVVTNPTGSVTSTPTTLTVLAPPIIETDPQDMCVAMDSSITLSVTASGRDLSYQWFQGVNLLVGETTDTLTVTVTATTTYSVEVSNAAGVDTSEDAVITIVTIPQITVQPSSVSNQLTGNDVTFTAEATVNCGDISYQWCKDGVLIPQSDEYNELNPLEESVKRAREENSGKTQKYSGSTTNSLTIHNIMYPDDEGVFTLKVTNDAAAVIVSMSATLDILDPPMITIQPLSLPSAPEGEDATFTVEASGLMLSYQWQKNGVPIVDTENTYSGTQSETLRVLSVTEPDDNGMFRVVVTNPTGSVTSTPATLTVLAPPIIETDPQDMCVAMDSSITLSVTASGRDLSYQWFQGVNLLVGETTDTLTVTVTATTTYSVEVSNAAGVDTSEDAVITIVTIPQFTVQPSSMANQLTGNDVTFTAEATVNCGDISYQWCKDGVLIPQSDEYNELNPLEESVKRAREENSGKTQKYSGSTTNSLTIHNIMYPDDEGVFTLKVTNDAAAVIESMSATLDILDPPMITIQPLSLPSAPEGEDATFTVEASGLMLSYQWQKDGVPIVDTENTYSGTQSETLRVLSVTEPDDNGMFTVVVTNPTGSVTSMPATLTVLVAPTIEEHPENACVTSGSTVSFSVAATSRDLSYQWFSSTRDESPIMLVNIVGGVSGATTSQLTITGATATKSYYVVVLNAAGDINSNPATLTIVTAPDISIPTSLTNQIPGDDVMFTVAASAECGGLTYQWFMEENMLTDGDKYTGATTNTLTVMNIVHPSDEGDYSVQVTNAAGRSISTGTLDIVEPISITRHPMDTTVAIRRTATFTVMADGDSPSYQWMFNGNPITETPSKFIGVTTSTLMVLNAVDEDEGMYSVMVTNAASPAPGVVSNPATLTALRTPEVTGNPADQLTVQPGDDVMFTCRSTGDDLVYAWLKDGVVISDQSGIYSGAMTPTLTVIDAQEQGDEGSYACMVSNDVGDDTSESATLEIVNCADIPAAENGDIGFSMDRLTPAGGYSITTVATYSCITGQLFNGDTTRTCLSTGEWSGIAPVCLEYCTPLTLSDGDINYSNDANEQSSFVVTTTATHSCDTRFSLEGGVAIRRCMSTDSPTGQGNWGGSERTCEPTCPLLNAPGDGRISYEPAPLTNGEYGVGAVAMFSCDSDFDLFGSTTRTCQGDHMWDNTESTCQRACPPLDDIDNGAISYSPEAVSMDGNYAVDTVAMHTCNPNYGRSRGARKRTCRSDGQWTSRTVTCELIMCEDIPDPLNGNIVFEIDTVATFDILTTATYSCDPGYSLQGSDVVRTCTGTSNDHLGTFDGVAPTCEPIICTAHSEVSQGTISYEPSKEEEATSGDTFLFGTVATLACGAGFFPVGPESSTCGGDGSSTVGAFEPDLGSCEAAIEVVMCPHIPSPLNGCIDFAEDYVAPFDLGTVATYSCESGFALMGSEMRTCVTNGDDRVGVWSLTETVCVDITCNGLEELVGGSVVYDPAAITPDVYSFGTEAMFSCDAGMDLVGSPLSTCGGLDVPVGEFTPSLPQCLKPIELTLSLMNNVITEGADLTACVDVIAGVVVSPFDVWVHLILPFSPPAPVWFTITVELSANDACQSLLDFNVANSISDGTNVIPDDDVDNGDIVVAVFVEIQMTPSDSPTISVNPSFTLLTILDNDFAIMCPDIPDPDFGQIAFTTDNTAPFEDGTTALYSCNSGYVLSSAGINPRVCGGDGSSSVGEWTGAALTCIPQAAPSPIVPTVDSRGLSQVISSDFSVSFDQRSYEVSEGTSETVDSDSSKSTKSPKKNPDHVLSVCVVVSGSLESQLSVHVSTAEDTAKGSKDYTDLDEELKFDSAGQKCVDLVILGDSVYEGDEELSVSLSYSQSSKTAIVTIKDDDQAKVTLSGGSVCEGAGFVTVRVQLDSDIETDVIVSLETSDLTAEASDDYYELSQDLTFTAPLNAPSELTVSVVVNNDRVLEPCEEFLVSLSSTDEGVVFDPAFLRVQINDDEDVSEFSLTNNSPQIYGKSLNATFELKGCAELTCSITNNKKSLSDCSPAPGSYEGQWYIPVATNSKTCKDLIIDISAHCEGQRVPSFESRSFRTDNNMCSVHFTDQQYEYDPESGDVTVEWEGTGPNEDEPVSKFMCKTDTGVMESCTSPLIIPGLTSGNHNITVQPVIVEGDGCRRRIARMLHFDIPLVISVQ